MFAYKGEYDDQAPSKYKGQRILVHAKVFTLADKYDFQTLMDAAKKAFASRTSTDWQLPVFAEAIKEIYTNGPAASPLKQLIIERVVHDAIELFESAAKPTPFQRVAASLPEFASELARNLTSFIPNQELEKDRKKILLLENEKRYKCSCTHQFVSSAPQIRSSTCCPGCSTSYSKSTWVNRVVNS